MTPTPTPATVYTYNTSAAIQWAKDNYNKTDGQCTTFVRRALKIGGGLSDLKDTSTPGALLDDVVSKGYGLDYQCTESNIANIKPGDFIIVADASENDGSTKYYGMHAIFVTDVNYSDKKLTFYQRGKTESQAYYKTRPFSDFYTTGKGSFANDYGDSNCICVYVSMIADSSVSPETLEGYLSYCTEYPCSAKITVKSNKDTWPKSFPCSADTNPNSKTLSSSKLAEGSTYTATALWKSSVGNCWYETVYSGKRAFIFAGDVTTTLNKPDVFLFRYSFPTDLVQGSSYTCKGEVISEAELLTVTVGISGTSISRQATGIHSDSYDIQEIAKVLDFASLSPGKYTVYVNVSVIQYSSSDGKGISESMTPISFNFSTTIKEKPVATKYNISFNAGDGSGSMSSFAKSYGDEFRITKNSFTRSGYDFKGWNLYRNGDKKWYVAGEGWKTATEISQNSYTKKLYSDEQTLTIDDTWVNGYSGTSSYTFYAVWRKTSLQPVTDTVETYVKIQSTSTNNMKTEPYAAGDNIRKASIGEEFVATKIVTNSYGNYWYYIPSVDGYINADNCKYVGPASSSMITFDGTDISGSIKLNNSNQYHLPGYVRQRGNVSVKLTAEILPSGSSTATTSSSQTFSADSMKLCSKSSTGTCSNNICLKLKFGVLSKGVEYRYKLTAEYTLYHCKDNDDQASLIAVKKTESRASTFSIANPSHTIYFSGNGGSGSMSSITLVNNQNFNIPLSTFSRSGYSFEGWNLYRENDGKWFVLNSADDGAWKYESEISGNGYRKKLYTNGKNLTFDSGWTSGIDESCSYMFYAVWESGCGSNISWYRSNYTLYLEGSGSTYDYNYSENCLHSTPWADRRNIIEKAVVSDGITDIGESVFEGCTNMTLISLPSTLKSISRFAFYNCGSLEDMCFAGTESQWNSVSVAEHNEGLSNARKHFNIASYGYCGNNLKWFLTNDGTLTISGTGEMYNYSSSVAPWYSKKSSIKSAVIEEGVTSIGDYAFYGCDALTSVVIPNSVTSIGRSIFSGCTSLISVVIPNSVTSIGDYVFYECGSLTSVVISNSVTSIGKCAFCYCGSLTSVTIPNSVTSIGDYAFYECGSLTSVTIPNSVTSIGKCAFYECSSLTSVTIGNSVTSIGDYAFYECGSLTSVVISNSVTSIGKCAFYECSSLTSVTIGNSVTSIGDYAFYECSSLTSVIIGNSVTSIGNGAFCYCGSLTSVTIPNSVTSIGNYAFRGCSSLSSVTIPDSVTSIGDDAFASCRGLSSVTIGNSVTSIGNYAFSRCSSLTSVVIPDSVTSIGDEGFSYCGSLTSVTIGNSVTNIGNGAFCECNSLTSIEIPDSVTSIGDEGFSYCGSLTSVTIGNSVTSIGNGAFCECNSLTSIEIPDSVTSIGDEGFSYCGSLTSVTIGNSVTIIGDYAFAGCGNLTSIEIPGSVTSIGNAAFYECSSLTSIEIPDSVTSIGNAAFCSCISLTSVTIPDSVTSIGNLAFYECSILTSVTIGNSVTSIGYYAFYKCSSLTSVVIPDSVTSISDYAFAGCGNLTSIEIPNSVTGIGNYAFAGCSSLTSIEIPNGVTCISEYAFFNCQSLASVSIPDSVTSIGGYAFPYCSSLVSIEIPNSVTSIGDYAFCNCSSLEKVVISESVTSIGYMALSNCDNLEAIYVDENNANYSSLNGVLFNKSATEIICLPGGFYGNYSIPESVTSIGALAFINCHNLTGVTIGNNVTSIGGYAFAWCNNLMSAEIPDSVTSISEYTFAGCLSLQSFVIPNSVTNIGNHAFYKCSNLESITIPDSVTSIGEFAFAECSCLQNVDYSGTEEQWKAISIDSENEYLTNAYNNYTPIIGSGTCGDSVNWTLDNLGTLTISGTGAMYDYSGDSSPWFANNSIKKVDIEYGVTSIGNYTFVVCSSLTRVTIGNSVTSIGDCAFCICTSLESIEIPDSVTNIGDYAFYECNGLQNVYYSGTREQWNAISIGSENEYLTCANIFFNDFFKISYNINNSNEKISAQIKIAGTPLTLSTLVPTRSGYKFLGWATEDGSKTVVYQPGDEYTEDADITLHAVWKMPGDVNGDGKVNTKDFVALMRYCAGDRTITFDPNALDIDGNGKVETLDFITLMQFIAGKDVQIY